MPKQWIALVTQFLNESGNWQRFVDFLDEQGYAVTELGFEDGED